MSFAMNIVPESKAGGGKTPDENSSGVKEIVAGLVGAAEARAGGPENKLRSSAEVFFRNKSKITAISTACVVVAEHEVGLRGDFQTELLNKGAIDLSIGV